MLTLPQLKAIMPRAGKRAVADYPHLTAAMQEFGISSSLPQTLMFVANVAHETAELRYLEEIWGPTPQQRRYDPPGALARELGNVELGDGCRFRGRGCLQVTGRGNYAKYGHILGLDLV